MEIGCFRAGLGVCASIVLAIITIIHRRFLIMMVDLSEGEEWARFWTLAVAAWFALYSISSTLKCRPEGASERQLLLAGMDQATNGFSGASTAVILFSIGLIVLVVIRKYRGCEDDMLGRKSA